MDKFSKKNELGVMVDYYIVALTSYDSFPYVVYTDFVYEKDEELRLYAGKLEDGEVIGIKKELEKEIIDDFKREKINFIENL